MFERLLVSIGNEAAAKNPPKHEIQLAATILLLAMAPADLVSLPVEHGATLREIAKLFQLNDAAARKLFVRAAAARSNDTALFPAATILKRSTDHKFRQRLLCSCRAIAQVDGEIHEFEEDLLQRLQHLIGVNTVPEAKTA